MKIDPIRQRLAKALSEHQRFCAEHGGIAPSLRAHPKSESYRIALEYEESVKEFYKAR